LVAVHDVGDVEGEPYLAEEFFEGHDLAELLRRCAAETWQVPVPVALHIGCVVSRTLVFLHEFDGLGLVHRKLRPAKMRVGFAGEVKLLDPTSGRAAGADGALGPALFADELPYLAPEQLAGGPVDRRADIYALGVVLWETLAGCSLLSTIEGGQAGLAHATRDQMIERIRAHQPLPPSRFNPEVRADVDVVVMRALATAPAARFATAGDFELALIPITGQAGPDAAASLLSHLFDAGRERAERAALLAQAVGGGSLAARGEPPVGSGSSWADLRGVGASALSLTSAPVRANPLGEGGPPASSRSRTTVVSRNSQWLRRFFLIFGVLLVAAIAFNIYMTRRLDAEAAAGAPQPSASAALPVPPAPAVGVAGSAATAATGRSAGESPTARPSQGAEPPAAIPPLGRPNRPAAGPAPAVVAAARPLAGSAPELPAERTRPRASGDGKKALLQAHAAFERDDFAQAILLGRAALAAGEGGAHNILGAAYFKVGRFGDAAREYAEALRLEPGNPVLAKRLEIARRAASRRAEGATP
jgi:serine/threonine-protein kinase